jgi:hypothetical protein
MLAMCSAKQCVAEFKSKWKKSFHRENLSAQPKWSIEGTKYLLLIDLSALDFDTNTPFSPFSYRITTRDW